MEFLGHQVRGDVITPSFDNLEKVRNTPRPTTKKQVRSFLGVKVITEIRYQLHRYFSTIDRPPKERKGRTYLMVRGTVAFVLAV